MKILIKSIGLLCALFMFSLVSAQSDQKGKYETVSFQVEGVCNMCKTRIETTSYDVSGVKSAKWDLETGKLTAVIHKKKASKQKIADALAAAGYRSELAKADPKAYGKLPDCCKYDDGVQKHGDRK